MKSYNLDPETMYYPNLKKCFLPCSLLLQAKAWRLIMLNFLARTTSDGTWQQPGCFPFKSCLGFVPLFDNPKRLFLLSNWSHIDPTEGENTDVSCLSKIPKESFSGNILFVWNMQQRSEPRSFVTLFRHVWKNLSFNQNSDLIFLNLQLPFAQKKRPFMSVLLEFSSFWCYYSDYQ